MNLLDQNKWATLWRSTGASGDPQPQFARLVAAYSEPQRHYHNQQHIVECLIQFDEVRHLTRQPEAIEFALWFHDAVYDPKAADNEEKSMLLAKKYLGEVLFPTLFVEKISTLIMATKSHEVDADADAALMVDVDLNILGQNPERFGQYELQIRQEYNWVPEVVFNEKRAEILKRFLSRKNIYATEWFRDKFERQARKNLTESIEKLWPEK